MLRIAHLSDLHNRNLKYFDKYLDTFDDLFLKLRSLNPDIIVFAGDLLHTKIQISGEAITLSKEFIRRAAEIAPVYMILGNHDSLIKNKNRISAVVPIAEQFDNVKLYTKSGIYPIDKTDVNLFIFSVLDENQRFFDKKDVASDKINIGVYHGCIADSKNAFDHKFSGENTISIFDDLDFVLLGDIHEKQKIDKEGRMWYPGSIIQQNHGETEEKGFLIWDIESKNNWSVSFHKISSPLSFKTINLNPDGSLPEQFIKPGSHLRLISNSNLPMDVLRGSVDEAKKLYKPESLVFFNEAGNIKTARDVRTKTECENLRNQVVQEKLIRDYLKNYEVDEDIIKNVFEINRRYTLIVEGCEEVARNVYWNLEKIEFDYLFNFGKDNYIDFTKKKGLVGIFGKNFIGKSSSLETINYTLFNGTSKDVRKNLNIVNQNKDRGSGCITISVDNERYVISRETEKYTKKLHGDATVEAKTEVEMHSYNLQTGEETSWNGASRGDTDKNIRKLFGTLDDFLLISMASQTDSLAFVKEGSTKRKEIFARFMDLEIFDQKFQLAKEDSSDLKNEIKELEKTNYDEEIEKLKENIVKNDETIEEKKKECGEFQKKYKEIEEKLFSLKFAIDNTPVEVIDKKVVDEKIKRFEKQLQMEMKKKIDFEKALQNNEDKFRKASDAVNNESFDIGGYENKLEECSRKEVELEEIKRKIKYQEETIGRLNNKIKILKNVPCESRFQETCEFVKEAFAAQKIIIEEKKQLQTYKSLEKQLQDDIQSLDRQNLEKDIKKRKEILKKRNEAFSEIESLKLKILSIESNIQISNRDLTESQNELKRYFDNEKSIKEINGQIEERDCLENTKNKLKKLLNKCEEEAVSLYQERGSNVSKLESRKEKKEKLLLKRKEYSAYDMFMRCFHMNGIAKDIIKEKLPIVNEEISKILSNVVSFEVFLELIDNKLEIFIKHPKYDARPLGGGSGAEFDLAAIAIRLAFLTVTSLPVSNIFILDEPATNLDSENLDGFVRILDVIKNYFQCVFLITHLDSLKDCVDEIIVIEKDEAGFARIKQ